MPAITLHGPEGIEERITAVLEGYVVGTHLRCGYRVGRRWLADRYALARHVELRLEAGWERNGRRLSEQPSARCDAL